MINRLPLKKGQPSRRTGLMMGVTGQQGMVSPPGRLIPPLACPGFVFVHHFSDF
jgi:hypothetical protein